ncbi:Fc.00g091340.m01.CDS01 [Cosmosporella sp. VM-42]
MNVEDYSNVDFIPCSGEDEFKYIDVIPATQLSVSSEHDGTDHKTVDKADDKTGYLSPSIITTHGDKKVTPDSVSRVIRTTWTGTKRKRVESIHSADGEEPTTPKLDLAVLSLESPGEPKTPVAKRLKAVPRNAPRAVKTFGVYSIRNGIRSREFKVINRITKPFLSPTNIAEFQCRDGFAGSQGSLGYLQPMKKRESTQTTVTSRWERSPLAPRSHQSPLLASTTATPGSINSYQRTGYEDSEADPSTLVASEDDQLDVVSETP